MLERRIVADPVNQSDSLRFHLGATLACFNPVNAKKKGGPPENPVSRL
jgi:hypothetical protein